MPETIYETFEDELEAIRLSLYEETRDMTPEEQIAYLKASTDPVMKEFNIKISSLKPIQPKKRAMALSE